MAGLNKVLLIGNLGADPEVRHLDGNKAVANFNIATTETYQNKNGERVDQTEWHRIELWDGLAGVAEKYLKKGSKVFIEGKLKTDSYTDKEGVNRTSTKIRATSMTMLDSRPSQDGGSSSQGYNAPQQQASSAPSPSADYSQNAPVGNSSDDLDELPF
jgi:single-strand DNA-binding protein